ncbi:hypothetical protein [Legionella sp. km772]|uniref:hypothetical protein n=1 Tax=Legionella sp. km772 TaxID=2498111 RepID=UPI000F8F4D9C|nr:hypothetical protein [Legionella sp. km772]RUR08707.1 hypothetical protein ELY15_10310 [Legionella sp. km772]
MMKNIPISDEVRRFILSNIPSVPHLEALLLMRSEPDHQWSISELAKRLFINEQVTQAILDHLKTAGVATEVGEHPALYQYNTPYDELKKLIDNLAMTYSASLIEVTNLIHSNVDHKAIKFANAFIWRKK